MAKRCLALRVSGKCGDYVAVSTRDILADAVSVLLTTVNECRKHVDGVATQLTPVCHLNGGSKGQCMHISCMFT